MREIIVGLNILLLGIIVVVGALASNGEIVNQSFLAKTSIWMGVIVVLNLFYIGLHHEQPR